MRYGRSGNGRDGGGGGRLGARMAQGQKIDWAERRTSRRITVTLPLLVRGQDIHGHAFEDTTSSYNVSRDGASFLTTRELAMGQPLALIIPRPPLRPERVSHAHF